MACQLGVGDHGTKLDATQGVELGAMISGVKLAATSVPGRQSMYHLSAMNHSAETCDLGAVNCGADP
jgi:hypothetical protein